MTLFTTFWDKYKKQREDERLIKRARAQGNRCWVVWCQTDPCRDCPNINIHPEGGPIRKHWEEKRTRLQVRREAVAHKRQSKLGQV